MLDERLKIPKHEIVKPYNFSRNDGLIIWMDGSGSNGEKVNDELGVARLVVSGRADSKAAMRAKQYGVPLVQLDLGSYEESKGVHDKDFFKAMTILGLQEKLKNQNDNYKRAEIFLKIGKAKEGIVSRLTPEQIYGVRDDFCRYFRDAILEKARTEGIDTRLMFAAGGDFVLTPDFVNEFTIVNMHPARLGHKYNNQGTRRLDRSLTGLGWIPSGKAIAVGEDYLTSSTHLMTAGLDEGPVFMEGHPLHIDYNLLTGAFGYDPTKAEHRQIVGSAAQAALLKLGDHVIGPATFDDMFDGMWGVHEKSGLLAFKHQGEWYKVPHGIKMEDYISNNLGSRFIQPDEFIKAQQDQFYRTIETKLK